MDTVTHAMFGALASRVVTGKASAESGNTGKYVPLGVTAAAAAFPDSDYLLFPIDPLQFLAEWHRSFTHSFIMLPLWAVLLTGLIVLLFPRLRSHILMIGGFVVLGLASHIMLDLLTVYGTKIFYPLADTTISLGTTFVIDPYFSLVIFAGLVISFFCAPRFTALASITLLCIYVLFEWQLKIQAREIGESMVTQGDATVSKITALPQPFSPFHWRIIISENQHYTTALIDLAGVSEKLRRWHGTIPFIELVSSYRDSNHAEQETYTLFGELPEQQDLARTVWLHNEMAPYRKFARFPILYRIDQDEFETCVWFSDLRYHISIMLPSFRYGMCRSSDNGEWKRYRLKYFSEERD